YDVTEGSIRINGVDVRQESQVAVREKIGLVPQQAFLFSGSVADNIRYGNNDATMEEVKFAAKIAQADDFISNMEDGYETIRNLVVANLFGEQKEQMAIDRVLVRRSDIYLFDDCFSTLDFKTDGNLRQVLKEEVTDAYIVIVAQRVSSVMDADRILVLDNGEVKGIGTHNELLKMSEVYQEIVKSQQGEEETG